MAVTRRALLASSLASLATLTTSCVAQSVRAVSKHEAAAALAAAKSRLGDPYVWAGQAPGGFDCSGLIIWAYEQVLGLLRLRRPDGRIVADATINELYTLHCIRLRPNEARPGDIVAIAEDGGTVATHGGLVEHVIDEQVVFINASSYYGKVVSDAWPLIGTKRDQYVLGFGRLVIAERLLFGFMKF